MPRAVLSDNFCQISNGDLVLNAYCGIPCDGQVQYSLFNPVGWSLLASPRVFQVRMHDADAQVEANQRAEFYEYGVAGNEPVLRVKYQVGTNVPAYTLPAIGFSGMSPTSGSPGTSVTITGSGFCAAQSAGFVSFNGVHASSYTVWGDTSITVTVPAGAATGAVWVTNACGAGVSAGVFTVSVPSSVPSLLLTKTVTNISLAGTKRKAIPGATIEILVSCSNSGTNIAYKPVVYEALQFQYVSFATNSLVTAGGWTPEWSTNISPNQAYGSSDYTGVCPAAKKVRWIRWKRPSLLTGTGSQFRYRVIVR